METMTEKIRRELRNRAFDLASARIEDLEISQEEYREFFENLASYCLLVDQQNSLVDLILLAEKEKLYYSSIFSVEDFMETFFTCNL